ncbi:hypothetical protein KSS87_011930 [Heliosperma pusillum]|nr:hypothetical protein KSS87_011930 [Heliosperma pusillum]
MRQEVRHLLAFGSQNEAVMTYGEEMAPTLGAEGRCGYKGILTPWFGTDLGVPWPPPLHSLGYLGGYELVPCRSSAGTQKVEQNTSSCSWNATYGNLLGTNKPFPQPIPLPEMVDFLVDVWEQEGLYD